MVTHSESARGRTRSLLTASAVVGIAIAAVAIALVASPSETARAAGGTFSITNVDVLSTQPVPAGDVTTFVIDYACESADCTDVEMFIPLPAGLDPQWVVAGDNTIEGNADALSITYVATAPQGYSVVFDAPKVGGTTGELLATFNTAAYAGNIPDGHTITLEPTFTELIDTSSGEPIWESGPTADSVFGASLELALTTRLASGALTAATDEPVTYEIFVCNPNFAAGGDLAGTNVVITDAVPPGAVFVSADNGGTESGGVVTWNLAADVYADCNVFTPTVSMTVTFPRSTFGPEVDSTVINEVTNGATVAGEPIGETTVVVTADGSITHGFDDDPAVPMIDLELIKTVDGNNDGTFADDETIALDTPFTWRLTVTNDGPDDATGIEVMDYPPAGLTISAADQTTFDISTGLWTVGDLPAGDSVSVDLTTVVSASDEDTHRAGTGINWAEVTRAGQEDIDSEPGTNTADGIGDNKGTDGPNEDDEDSATAQLDAIVYVPVIDLEVDKQVDADGDNIFAESEPVGPDSPFTWRITVTNDGDDDATGVELTDYQPAGVTLTAADNAAFDITTGVWTIGSLEAGASMTTNLTAVIDAANADAFEAGSGINWAEISAADQDDIDSEPGTNTADGIGDNKGTDATNEDDEDDASVTYVAPIIDLEVTKTVDGSGDGIFTDSQPITIGMPFDWRITVANNGPDDATGVELTDHLPDGVELTGSDQTGFDISTGIWPIGSIANGETVTVNLTAVVSTENEDTFLAGTGSNWAEISAADQEDLDSEPGRGTADGTGPDKGADGTAEDDEDEAIVVALPTPQIDLAVDKRVDGDGDGVFNDTEAIDLDTPYTWRIVVTNNGPDDATGVTVQDYPPAGMTITATDDVDFDTTTGLWTIGSIANGQSVTVNLTSIVTTANADAFMAGAGINWAEVTTADQDDVDSEPGADTADGTGPDKGDDGTIEDDEDNAAVTLTPDPQIDLSINKRIDGNNDGTFGEREAIEVDTPYTWRIIVTNNGPDDGTGVTVQEYFPAGVTVTDADDDGFDVATGSWTIGTLANGATRTVNLTAVVREADAEAFLASDGVNWAEVSGADQEDTDSKPGLNTADGEGDDIGDDGTVEDDEDNAVAELSPAAPQVDLTLAKTRLDDLVPGQQARWSLVVTNLGPDTDPGPITLTDNLPPALTAVSASGGGFSCSISGDLATIDCSRGTPLAAGESATVIITTQVDAGTANGTSITNNAVVGSGSTEQTMTNNADTGTGSVQRPVGNDLPITGSRIALLLGVIGTAFLAWGANLKLASNRV